MLLPLLLLACTGASPEAAPGVDTEPVGQIADASPFTHDVVFLVWIPYDNDLGRFVPPVVLGLMDGSAGGVEVVAQVDKPGQPGMQRAILRQGAGEVLEVPREDSGDIEAFAEFLDWAADRYEARAYAVVIMNHGGDLTHLARDDHPDPDAVESSWLEVGEIAEVLSRFRREESGEVELLALQVCGKASIEPLRTLAPAARHLLASQLPLGAPNTWYRDALGQISAHPEWTGADWIRAIASSDEPHMYAAVSCFEGAALEATDPVGIELSEEEFRGPLAGLSWTYAGETYVDLHAAARLAGRPTAPLEALSCGVHRSEAPAALLTEGFPDHRVLSGLSAAARPMPGGGWILDPAAGEEPVLPPGG